jgi:hypothetical protein
LIAGVVQHAARIAARVGALLHEHLAVDDGVVDALGQLSHPPAIARKIVDHVFGDGAATAGAVTELLGEVMPTSVKRLGVVGFGESGDAKGLYAKHGLDPDGIARSVLKFLNR